LYITGYGSSAMDTKKVASDSPELKRAKRDNASSSVSFEENNVTFSYVVCHP